MKTARFILTIFIFAVIVSIGEAAAQVFRFETAGISLVYEVSKDGVLMLNGAEAFPAAGGAYYGEPAVSLVHSDGSIVTELVYDGSETLTASDGVPETVLRLKDRTMPFFVELHIVVYKEQDVIAQWAAVRNCESGPVTLYNCGASFLPLSQGSYWLTKIVGSGLAEASEFKQEHIGRGATVVECRRGTRTTRFENPSFILSAGAPAQENSGFCIGGALAWSGNFRLAFESDASDRLTILSGESPYLWARTLDPGEEYTSPRMLWTFSTNGRGQVSRNFHDWGRTYGLDRGFVPGPIVLNSWEGAYFDFDEKTLLGMMDAAAELGVEMFVLDDGWFGNKYPRNNDDQGLGDWQINKKKLPHGIKYLADYAASKGIGFGIWVEPEMVNPRSKLFEKHPEWVVKSPGRAVPESRHQWVLDLCNPAVQDFVFNTVDNLLKDNPGIKYVKWDANRFVANPGSSYLAPDRQTHFWHDYVAGLYSVYERLRKAWPQIIFQDCSSGGGRVDYGALKWHNEFWGSDNTDPLKRIRIQWGEGLIYPPKAIASHVSASPNHQTGRIYPLKFRFDVAMSARLGMELQPASLNPEERAFAKMAISNYKEHIRPLVAGGDLYRLISPDDDPGNVAAEMFVAKDKSKAVLFVWYLDYVRQNLQPHIRLSGLDQNASYKLTELNVEKSRIVSNGQPITATLLQEEGLVLNLTKPYQSAVVVLEKVN